MFGQSNTIYEKQIVELLNQIALPEEILVKSGFAYVYPSLLLQLLVGSLSAFMFKSYVIILTNQRILMVNVSAFGKFQDYIPFITSQLKLCKYSKGFLNAGLELQFPDKRTMHFTFNKIKGNADVAFQIAEVLKTNV